MKKVMWVVAGMLIGGCAMAADAGRWHSGFGQGTFEYFVVDAKQNQLYIACSADNPGTMTLTLAGKEYGNGANQGFSLIIDGKQVDAPYNAESRVGSANFHYAWDAIRKAKSLQAKTDSGKVISLPLVGAPKALPARKSKNFPCLVEF